jgi:hypothetical protein
MSVIKFPEQPSGYRSVVFEWLAADASEGRVDPLHIVDLAAEIYAEMDELRAMIGAPPSPRRLGGRPPKGFTARLAFFAGIWMEANATESAAELVRAMEAECDRRGWELGNTQLRELAADFMEEFRALRRRG